MRSTFLKTVLLASLFSCVASLQATHSSAGSNTPSQQQNTGIQFTKFYARATAGGNGAFFGVLKNQQAINDRLVEVQVSPDLCAHVELHTHIHEGEIKRMRPVKDMPISSKATLKLQPGGLHVMLMGLKRPLIEGETFKATLIFENSPALQIQIPIKKAGYRPACGCSAVKVPS